MCSPWTVLIYVSALLDFDKDVTVSFSLMIQEVWSLYQQHQYYLETHYKCIILAPILPSNLQNPTLVMGSFSLFKRDIQEMLVSTNIGERLLYLQFTFIQGFFLLNIQFLWNSIMWIKQQSTSHCESFSFFFFFSNT